MNVKDMLESLSKNVDTATLNSARILSTISYRLYEYRMDHHIDQRQMAKILGVSQPMVSKYESGDYNFTIRTLSDISQKIGFTLDVVFKKDNIAEKTNRDENPEKMMRESVPARFVKREKIEQLLKSNCEIGTTPKIELKTERACAIGQISLLNNDYVFLPENLKENFNDISNLSASLKVNVFTISNGQSASKARNQINGRESVYAKYCNCMEKLKV